MSAAVVDSRVDPARLVAAFDHAILRGSPEHELADFDRQVWGIELLQAFGHGGHVIAAMQLALAEQELMIAALEARLSDMEEKRQQPYRSRSIGDMIAWVSKRTGIPAIDIRGDSRKSALVMCRQAIAWVAHEKLGHTHDAIARRLGERNHSTIITQVRRATSRREIDEEFRDLTDALVEAFTLRQDRISREYGA